jgi:cobalamin biosynthesis protein CobT
MREVHAQVMSQSEFTAQRVADEAGISKVWLYHIAGEEFRALRAELPGSRKTRDEEVAVLRQENAQLRTQLKAAQEQAHLASSTALKKAMVMLEQWEQENLELRGHIRLLTRRLEQAGGYVDITPSPSQAGRKGYLKPVDS